MKAFAKDSGGARTRDASLASPTRRSQRATLPGLSLPGPLRASLEAQFGASLAALKVHDTAEAHRAAKRHRANAFTVGSDIYFGKGRYRPTESSGRPLIVHEATHVLQHANAGAGGASIAAAEREAAAMAAQSGSQAMLPPVTHTLAPGVAPALRDAATLKQALEDELDDVFVRLENVWPQIRQESQSDRDAVRRDGALERYIRQEASAEELLKTYLLLTYQTEEQYPVHFREFLDATTEMVGTHEARVYAILRGVSQAERQEMIDMPGFVEVIEDEMSGRELRHAWDLLYGRVTHTGTDISPVRTSTHLETSERYELAVEVSGSLETVENNLTEAATASTAEVPRSVLLDDTSLWAEIADEFDRQELWYLRMIARYGGKGHFPKLTGPSAPTESCVLPKREGGYGAGTHEEQSLVNRGAAPTAPTPSEDPLSLHDA
ncbi:MAG: DUF4157 domain-containing protein, partial [Burkholderiales bacterium]|nr:DUF4157 domain-containing protein [Burkholderiales bacterium]